MVVVLDVPGNNLCMPIPVCSAILENRRIGSAYARNILGTVVFVVDVCIYICLYIYVYIYVCMCVSSGVFLKGLLLWPRNSSGLPLAVNLTKCGIQ